MNEAEQFLADYNTMNGKGLVFSNTKKILIQQAIDCNEENYKNGIMLSEVSSAKSFTSGISNYISRHKNDIKHETKSMDVASYMGLLEKTLADVIVKDQGESIKKELIGGIQEQVAEFIAENYGTITRNVVVQVGETKTEFKGEILHEKFDECLAWLKCGFAPFLTGPAGCGKNVLAEQLARALGVNFYFTNAVTDEVQIKGFSDAYGIYHETEFYKAFKNGGLFMLDEMDASIPEALIMLNMALANGWFVFPEGKDRDGNPAGGMVKAHKDFKCISAGNTFGLGADCKYVGRNQLDMASLDRFAQVEIDYDKNIELKCANGDTELVDFAHALRKSANDNGIEFIFSYRSISRVGMMKDVIGYEKALKGGLYKALRNDDINILIADADSNNTYIKETRKFVK